MKKYMITILATATMLGSGGAFAQTKAKKDKDGCPITYVTRHHSGHSVKHHMAKKTPAMMHRETVIVDETTPTTVVKIDKGKIYINDKLVGMVVNPKHEDQTIIINTDLPKEVVVQTDNSYTGNKPDMPMLGLYTNNDCEGGAMIKDILPDGPAARAGLYPGDVITKLNDNDITNSEQLVVAIYKNNPGDNVSITYKHDGRTETTEAKLIDASKVANCVNPQMGAACGCSRGHMHEREYGYSKW